MKQRLAYIIAFSIALISLSVGCSGGVSKNGASDKVTTIDGVGIKPENDQEKTQLNVLAPVKEEESKKQNRVQAAVLEKINKRLEESGICTNGTERFTQKSLSVKIR